MNKRTNERKGTLYPIDLGRIAQVDGYSGLDIEFLDAQL